MGILKSVLGYVDTEKYSYADLFNEINANSGGILFGLRYLETRKIIRIQTYRCWASKAKTLYSGLPFVFSMIKEILCTSKMDDTKRLYEIIAKDEIQTSDGMASAGHSTAVMRATSYFSANAYFQGKNRGIEFYQFIDRIKVILRRRRAG